MTISLTLAIILVCLNPVVGVVVDVPIRAFEYAIIIRSIRSTWWAKSMRSTQPINVGKNMGRVSSVKYMFTLSMHIHTGAMVLLHLRQHVITHFIFCVAAPVSKRPSASIYPFYFISHVHASAILYGFFLLNKSLSHLDGTYILLRRVLFTSKITICENTFLYTYDMH